MDASEHEPDEHTMRCMEVWGGNAAVDNGVAMPGMNAWVYSRPYGGGGGGGDVHFVSSCAMGKLARFLVADVSGHGEAVADVAGTLRGLMRKYVNCVEQTRLVERLNTAFSELAETGRFATAVITTFFAPTGEISVCNAGHPRPLWYEARSRRWCVVRQDCETGGLVNIPLGVAAPTRYEQLGLRLRRGDLLLLYTDSLTEARSPGGRLLGEEGLLGIVRDLDADEPDRLIPAILRRVAEYRGGPASDDETVLLLAPNGFAPRTGVREVVGALGAFVRAGLGSLRPAGAAR